MAEDPLERSGALASRSHRQYVSPLLEARENRKKGLMGLYARAPIPPGEVLVVWAGRIVTGAELAQVPQEPARYVVQIEEDLYLLSVGEPEPADFINHSCEPNAGLRGQIVVVSMRAIEAGEEVCIDYAMSDGSPYDEFECGCGTPSCRGRITGEDWRRPELWERYAGYFSPYLQRRIEALRGAERGRASRSGSPVGRQPQSVR
ncbi:MAG: hypothetical protein KatS3mg102_1017 [Planctomycetota bacterium]|nr:MAG: hypothetical protein KatS3mg102_1017 [Planctomycetota bacterium]